MKICHPVLQGIDNKSPHHILIAGNFVSAAGAVVIFKLPFLTGLCTVKIVRLSHIINRVFSRSKSVIVNYIHIHGDTLVMEGLNHLSEIPNAFYAVSKALAGIAAARNVKIERVIAPVIGFILAGVCIFKGWQNLNVGNTQLLKMSHQFFIAGNFRKLSAAVPYVSPRPVPYVHFKNNSVSKAFSFTAGFSKGIIISPIKTFRKRSLFTFYVA